MNLYVAGKWEDRERVRDVMASLIAAGHSITYDWTQSEQFSVEQAALDMEGVFRADALVFVADLQLPYKGALVEMGMALALDTPVYIIGPGIDKCIFTCLPLVHRGIDALLGPSVEMPERAV